MTVINAFKMDGLGNDFIIIDQRSKIHDLTKKQIIKICDRKFYGCDQLIYIKKSRETDAELEFYNSDGSKVGACGNGTRCVAYLLSKKDPKIEFKDEILLKASRVQISKILKDKIVETNIGSAFFDWKKIPLIREVNTKNLNLKLIDNEGKEHFGGMAINVGNPHVIFFLENRQKLIYNDVRKFGFIKVYSAKNIFNCSHLKKIGIEPLSEELNFKYFRDKKNYTVNSFYKKTKC